jgi:hypothetical protein
MALIIGSKGPLSKPTMATQPLWQGPVFILSSFSTAEAQCADALRGARKSDAGRCWSGLVLRSPELEELSAVQGLVAGHDGSGKLCHSFSCHSCGALEQPEPGIGYPFATSMTQVPMDRFQTFDVLLGRQNTGVPGNIGCVRI